MRDGEWCVFLHGNPERVLVRVQSADDYAAFNGAIRWARKNGHPPASVTVDTWPPMNTRAVGYESAPIVRVRA